MTRYIDKSALVAKIKEHIETYNKGYANGDDSRADALEVLLHDIDTLEVKEVDLETELKQWWNNHYSKSYPFDAYVGHYIENNTVIEIIKYFFELGLKVSQKGEEV